MTALAALLALASSAEVHALPASFSGTWKIVKILPTHNPACWSQERARTLLGSTLKYGAHEMVWQGGAVPVPDIVSRTLSRRKFMDEYKVDLPELGIATSSITEFDLQHEDADITGATTEVPGDTVVLASPGRIVVSACGVFYSAVRPGKPAGAH